MTGPRRLLDQPGPSARLLRAADAHVPSEQARRAALLAAGSAAATLAASGSAIATGGGALLKSVLVWLGVGALGGATVAVVATNVLPARSPREPASAAAIIASARRGALPPRSAPTPVASAPVSEQAEPVPQARDAARAPANLPSARASEARDPSTSGADLALGASSVGRFANDEPASPNLYDQLHLIDEARAAATRHDSSAVLGLLDRYDRAYPRGQFVPESLALRIETLAREGDRARARALAAQFRRDYPQHPLSARVAAALGD